MDTTQTIAAPANHRPGYPEIAEGLRVRRIAPNPEGISPVVTLGEVFPGGKLSGPWTTIVEAELEQNPAHLRAVVHLKDLWEHFIPAPEIAKGLKVRRVINGEVQDELLTVGEVVPSTKRQEGWALMAEWEQERIHKRIYGVTPVFYSEFWNYFVPAYPPVVEGLQVQIRLDGDRLGGAIWTVGEVNGDWTSIIEWEQVSSKTAPGIGRRVGAATPIFVPKFWAQFAPAKTSEI